MKSKQTHPTVASVNAHIKKAGLKRYEFACALLDYLPAEAQKVQGSGEVRQCSHSWKSHVYRALSGKHVPRKDILLAFSNYLSDQ